MLALSDFCAFFRALDQCEQNSNCVLPNKFPLHLHKHFCITWYLYLLFLHGYALSKCYLNATFCVINSLDKILLWMLAITGVYVKRDFCPLMPLGTTR